MTEENHPAEEPPKPKKSSTRTWIIFFVVLAVLAWWLVPDMMVSYKLYMNKAHNTIAQDNLRGLHSACQAYWETNGPDQDCDASVAANQYGFQPSPKVNISGSGTAETFTATARHQDSATAFTLDAKGNVH